METLVPLKRNVTRFRIELRDHYMQAVESRDDWQQVTAAAAFAFALHGEQRRKGTTIPYIAHLMSVAALVLEHGGDEDQAIAGLLHDAIEDVGPEQEAVIADRFGPRVAGIVRACTDADIRPNPPWRLRKEAYIAHLEHAGPDALLVSACDKLHNARAIVTDLRTLGPAMFARFTGGKDGTLWYYGALAAVITRRLPGPLAVELAEAVDEIRHLADRAAAWQPLTTGVRASGVVVGPTSFDDRRAAGKPGRRAL